MNRYFVLVVALLSLLLAGILLTPRLVAVERHWPFGLERLLRRPPCAPCTCANNTQGETLGQRGGIANPSRKSSGGSEDAGSLGTTLAGRGEEEGLLSSPPAGLGADPLYPLFVSYPGQFPAETLRALEKHIASQEVSCQPAAVAAS
eukprot:RCo037692